MLLHEKIKVFRMLKGWSQEQIAEKLEMSVAGYSNIERGETDIQISRLKRIAEVMDVDLLELFSFGEKNVILLNGTNSNSPFCFLQKEQEKFSLELQKSQLL